MSDHSLKAMRQQFKDAGVFYTPPELAQFLRSLIPGNPESVYDPTCGRGNLLAAFPPETPKYGQDIDRQAVEDAKALVPNFTGAAGDVLTNPAFIDMRFPAIVANPPFSIKWAPNQIDERFIAAPTVPSASRADYAFLLHILHMLTDSGVAAALSFPGILYRGQREGEIRKWMVEQNYIESVIHIPGDTFTDTSIATACLVLRKDRQADAPIRFVDREHEIERDVPRDEIAANGYTLSVSAYLQPPQPETPPVDPLALELEAREDFLRRVKADLGFSQMVCQLEGWDMAPYFEGMRRVVTEAEAEAAAAGVLPNYRPCLLEAAS